MFREFVVLEVELLQVVVLEHERDLSDPFQTAKLSSLGTRLVAIDC